MVFPLLSFRLLNFFGCKWKLHVFFRQFILFSHNQKSEGLHEVQYHTLQNHPFAVTKKTNVDTTMLSKELGFSLQN